MITDGNSSTNPEVEEQEETSSSKKRARVRINQRAEPTLTDRQQREIWLDLGTAHEYATQNYKYEGNAEERARIAGRSSWRLVEFGAKLSRRTNMGVVIAFAHLDTTKHVVQDYVYISPNLCDKSKPGLRTMAQKINTEFKGAVHTYREAGRAEAAQNMEDKKRLIAEKAELQEQNERLQAQLAAVLAQAAATSRTDEAGASNAT
ncbi:unnamed protein product [Tilletia laevis]|nr:unnamed protein product [Tilletia laevis]CAD7068641.1 unnamed protein product [Tilletia caries]